MPLHSWPLHPPHELPQMPIHHEQPQLPLQPCLLLPVPAMRWHPQRELPQLLQLLRQLKGRGRVGPRTRAEGGPGGGAEAGAAATGRIRATLAGGRRCLQGE